MVHIKKHMTLVDYYWRLTSTKKFPLKTKNENRNVLILFAQEYNMKTASADNGPSSMSSRRWRKRIKLNSTLQSHLIPGKANK